MHAGASIRWTSIAVLCGALLAATGRAGSGEPGRMTLHYEPRFILEEVARKMNVELRADEPLPTIHFESRTPLVRFQDAVAPQWKFRPPRFANVYVVARNEIYLTDDPGYYRRLHRSLDESLAHEFTHYVQVRYQGASLDDESAELQAVSVQYAFRDENIAPVRVASAG